MCCLYVFSPLHCPYLREQEVEDGSGLDGLDVEEKRHDT